MLSSIMLILTAILKDEYFFSMYNVRNHYDYVEILLIADNPLLDVFMIRSENG